MSKFYSVAEAQLKLEYYCSYQERCHDEAIAKLKSMNMIPEAIDTIVVHLIENNFLNEERFACSFARGKHRIKFWGKVRIINELKFRHVSKYNIDKALKEITVEEYEDTFTKMAEHQWQISQETNLLKRKKKIGDFLLRKGYESHLVYEKLYALSNKPSA